MAARSDAYFSMYSTPLSPHMRWHITQIHDLGCPHPDDLKAGRVAQWGHAVLGVQGTVPLDCSISFCRCSHSHLYGFARGALILTARGRQSRFRFMGHMKHRLGRSQPYHPHGLSERAFLYRSVMEYPVIGDAVNLSAKLEKHNKAEGARAER